MFAKGPVDVPATGVPVEVRMQGQRCWELPSWVCGCLAALRHHMRRLPNFASLLPSDVLA